MPKAQNSFFHLALHISGSFSSRRKFATDARSFPVRFAICSWVS